MKRIAGLALVLSLSACASAPKEKPLSERILGVWTCTATDQGASTVAKLTYTPDGNAAADAVVTASFSGQPVEIKGTGVVAWKVLADGRVEETISSMKVSSGMLAGQPVPPAMVQPMVDQMIVGQKTTSTVVIADTTMTLTDEKNVVATCKR